MEIMTKATITPTDDGAALALDDESNNGHYRITFYGDNLTITVRDDKGRYSRVDRLTDATRTVLKNGEVSFEGFSSRLTDEVGVPRESARVSFKAKGEDGCTTCH
jgi:hypothetical protein